MRTEQLPEKEESSLRPVLVRFHLPNRTDCQLTVTHDAS